MRFSNSSILIWWKLNLLAFKCKIHYFDLPFLTNKISLWFIYLPCSRIISLEKYHFNRLIELFGYSIKNFFYNVQNVVTIFLWKWQYFHFLSDCTLRRYFNSKEEYWYPWSRKPIIYSMLFVNFWGHIGQIVANYS